MKLTLCFLLAVLVTGILSIPANSDGRFAEGGQTELSLNDLEEEKEEEETLEQIVEDDAQNVDKRDVVDPQCLKKDNVVDLTKGFSRDGKDAHEYEADVKNRTDCNIGKRRKKGRNGKKGTLRRENLSFPVYIEHRKDFKLDITPNNKQQEGKFGLADAVYEDGKKAFIMMKGDDYLTIEFPRPVYVRQFCCWTFVVKSINFQFFDERNKKIYEETWCPSRTNKYFNFGCTLNDATFYKVMKIVLHFGHEPPHFSLQNLFGEICMED